MSTVKARKNEKKLLGRGAYGAVYMGLDDETGKFVAIKEIPYNPASVASKDGGVNLVEKELAMVKSMTNHPVHPNVVQYSSAELLPDEGLLRIIMEYVPGGSLAGLIRSFGPMKGPVVQRYGADILHGLHFLHTTIRVCHRDIKPDNILISAEGVCKVTDFGVSALLQDGTLNGCVTVVGTPHYMPPEMLSGEKYGPSADIWSFGCVLYEMVVGKPPWYECSNPASVMFKVVQGTDPPPLPAAMVATVDEELKKVMAKCFAREPADRPTAAELLKMPFFEKLNTSVTNVTNTSTTNKKTDTVTAKSSSTQQRPQSGSGKSRTGTSSTQCDSCRSGRALFGCDMCDLHKQYCASCWRTVHDPQGSNGHHTKSPLLFGPGGPEIVEGGVLLDDGRLVDVMRPELSWACPKCTFLNHPMLEVCEMCESRP